MFSIHWLSIFPCAAFMGVGNGSDCDAFDFVEGELVVGAVVEFCGACAGVGGDLLSLF